jgi:hypothetical protein
MGRLRLVAVIGLSVILAAFAIDAVSASAVEPHFLPETGLGLKGTSGTSVSRTLAGSTVECTANKDQLNVTGDAGMTGEYSILFTGCKSLGLACTSSGRAAGEIATSGTFVLGRGAVIGTGTPVIVFKPIAFSFSCSFLTVKVSGNDACVTTPINLSVSTTGSFTIECKETSAGSGDQQFAKAFVLKSGEEAEEPLLLLTSINGGAATGSALITVAKVSPSVTAELMA